MLVPLRCVSFKIVLFEPTVFAIAYLPSQKFLYILLVYMLEHSLVKLTQVAVRWWLRHCLPIS